MQTPELLSDPVYHDEDAARVVYRGRALAGFRDLPALRRARQDRSARRPRRSVRAGGTADRARASSRCASG